MRATLEPPKRNPLATVTLTPDVVFAFAFTFFASTTGLPQPYGFCFAELSTCLLVALSNTEYTPTLAHLTKYTKVEVRGFAPLSRTLFYPFLPLRGLQQ